MPCMADSRPSWPFRPSYKMAGLGLLLSHSLEQLVARVLRQRRPLGEATDIRSTRMIAIVTL
jgi:hypothetical protein